MGTQQPGTRHDGEGQNDAIGFQEAVGCVQAGDATVPDLQARDPLPELDTTAASLDEGGRGLREQIAQIPAGQQQIRVGAPSQEGKPEDVDEHPGGRLPERRVESGYAQGLPEGLVYLGRLAMGGQPVGHAVILGHGEARAQQVNTEPEGP